MYQTDVYCFSSIMNKTYFGNFCGTTFYTNMDRVPQSCVIFTGKWFSRNVTYSNCGWFRLSVYVHSQGYNEHFNNLSSGDNCCSRMQFGWSMAWNPLALSCFTFLDDLKLS